MSYFSENPEAYDDIQVKGIALKFVSMANWQKDEEEIRDHVGASLIELQHSRDEKDKKLWDYLVEWAHEQISDQTNTYFEGLIP